MSIMEPTTSPEDSFGHDSSILPGSVFLIASDGRTLYLPIPSPFASDPLNWTLRKRVCALGTLFFFAIVGLSQMQGASLLLVSLTEEYTPQEMAPFRLDLLESCASLFIGFGGFLYIPLSLAIGRRPVFLLCTVLLLAGTIFAGFSQSFLQHVCARSLQGFAVGSCLSSILLMIIDLTFIHQRPSAIASFWSLCAVFSNAFLAPTPDIIQAGGTWRSFYWVWIGPCLISVFLAFFLCPETYFARPAVAFDGYIVAQSSTEKVKIYQDWSEVPEGKALPDTPEKSDWFRLLRELKFWGTGKKGGWKAMRACYPQIFLCLFNPLIFWIAILNAIVIGGLVSISATYVEILNGDPYNLSIRLISLTKLSSAVGAFLAWPASGLLTANCVRHLASRNKGVREPEHYLPAFILPVIFGCASLVMYGLAVKLHWHWAWIIVAIGFNYFSFIALFTANTLWATESFPAWAAAALVAVGGWSYCLSFVLSFAIAPVIKSVGFTTMMCSIGVGNLVVGCIGIPIAFWGKSCRRWIFSKWGSNEAGALRPQ